MRSQLRRSEDAFLDTLPENPERMKAIFRQRAIQLAKHHTDSGPVSQGIPALVFHLAKERYAIALKDIAEVLPFQGCTRVPGSLPHFLGVINLRGKLRPVVDLSRLLSGTASSQSGAILILRRSAALKVDSVEELQEIQPGDLIPSAQGQYVPALVPGKLALIDVETILSVVFSSRESRSL